MSLRRSCSHMSECLAGALARGEAAGVWGGRYLVEGGSLLCQVHGFPFAGGSGCPLPGAEMTRKVHRVWSRQRTVWPPRATGAADSTPHAHASEVVAVQQFTPGFTRERVPAPSDVHHPESAPKPRRIRGPVE